MGKNYNILINPVPPDPERIESFKDFDALLAQHHQEATKAKFKRPTRLIYIGSAIAASLILAIAFFGLNSNTPERYQQQANAYFASQPYVNPPLEDIELPSEVFSIEAEYGDTLTFKSGSRVIIPSEAFVDASGQMVTGNVDIEFIEMLDFVDFFISGIPMTYDSNGVQYQLESAGMVEIRGIQNGKKVNLAPGKALAVELKSTLQLDRINTAPPKFNIYQLDKEKREWVYSGLDQIEVLAESEAQTNDELSTLRQQLNVSLNEIQRNKRLAINKLNRLYPTPEAPQKPIKRDDNSGRQTLILDDFLSVADISDAAQQYINELRQNQDQVIVEFAPNSSPFRPEFASIDRATIDINSDKIFLVNFFREDDELNLRLQPVISEQAFDKALESYNQKMLVYEGALEKRSQMLGNKIDSLDQIFEQQSLVAQEDFETSLNELVASGKIDPSVKASFNIINRFTVHKFGIWNCDRPIQYDGQAVNVKLIDQDGKRILNKTAFLVNKSTNTIYRYLATNKTPMHYSDQAEFLIWVISDQNKLAVLNSKNANITNNKKELILQLSSKDLATEKDVRSVLYF